MKEDEIISPFIIIAPPIDYDELAERYRESVKFGIKMGGWKDLLEYLLIYGVDQPHDHPAEEQERIEKYLETLENITDPREHLMSLIKKDRGLSGMLWP